MNTYILNWHDEDVDKVSHIRINETQKRLIDYLINKFGLNDALDDYGVRISVEVEDEEIIDLTK